MVYSSFARIAFVWATAAIYTGTSPLGTLWRRIVSEAGQAVAPAITQSVSAQPIGTGSAATPSGDPSVSGTGGTPPPASNQPASVPSQGSAPPSLIPSQPTPVAPPTTSSSMPPPLNQPSPIGRLTISAPPTALAAPPQYYPNACQPSPAGATWRLFWNSQKDYVEMRMHQGTGQSGWAPTSDAYAQIHTLVESSSGTGTKTYARSTVLPSVLSQSFLSLTAPGQDSTPITAQLFKSDVDPAGYVYAFWLAYLTEPDPSNNGSYATFNVYLVMSPTATYRPSGTLVGTTSSVQYGTTSAGTSAATGQPLERGVIGTNRLAVPLTP